MSKEQGALGGPRAVSRRSLLEWLGTGCVLSLGGAVLASCGTSASGLDGGPADILGPRPGEGKGAGPFPFKPGEGKHSVYDGWGERTVDAQDLKQILASWKLRVDGLVTSPRDYTFADLVALPHTSMTTDFHCVEGWSVYDVPWNGVQLSVILAQVEPLSGATHISFHTIGSKYNESLPLSVAREPKTLLGFGIGGTTLPLKHGFPLRVVIPRLLGYKNAKYVSRIELADRPLSGYWVQAGYSYDGQVPADRLRPGKY